MENVVNGMLAIEEHARLKISDAEKMAKEMIKSAQNESSARIETIKKKADERIEMIDLQKKAEADAVIEKQNIEHNERIESLAAIFRENSEKICNEIFNDIIGA